MAAPQVPTAATKPGTAAAAPGWSSMATATSALGSVISPVAASNWMSKRPTAASAPIQAGRPPVSRPRLSPRQSMVSWASSTPSRASPEPGISPATPPAASPRSSVRALASREENASARAWKSAAAVRSMAAYTSALPGMAAAESPGLLPEPALAEPLPWLSSPPRPPGNEELVAGEPSGSVVKTESSSPHPATARSRATLMSRRPRRRCTGRPVGVTRAMVASLRGRFVVDGSSAARVVPGPDCQRMGATGPGW